MNRGFGFAFPSAFLSLLLPFSLPEKTVWLSLATEWRLRSSREQAVDRIHTASLLPLYCFSLFLLLAVFLLVTVSRSLSTEWRLRRRLSIERIQLFCSLFLLSFFYIRLHYMTLSLSTESRLRSKLSTECIRLGSSWTREIK
jgi:hypothetical protein